MKKQYAVEYADRESGPWFELHNTDTTVKQAAKILLKKAIRERPMESVYYRLKVRRVSKWRSLK